jgi:hypothetical protein
MKKTYMNMSPSVIEPLSTDGPPMTISMTPISPVRTAVPAPTTGVPVIVLATLRNSLLHAAREDEEASRGSAT